MTRLALAFSLAPLAGASAGAGGRASPLGCLDPGAHLGTTLSCPWESGRYLLSET